MGVSSVKICDYTVRWNLRVVGVLSVNDLDVIKLCLVGVLFVNGSDVNKLWLVGVLSVKIWVSTG